MFCEKCGNPLNEGTQFCPKCGAPVAAAASAAPAPAPAPAPSANASSGKIADVLDQNYYQLLRVSQTATEDEIRSAIKTERTRWSDRVPKGGEIGAKARAVVARIADAEATLLDPAARAEYDKTLQDSGEPVYQPTVQPNEKDWLDETFSLFLNGDIDMADFALGKMLAQQPNNPNAWFLASIIYMSQNKYDEANRAAQELLLIDPGNPSAYGVRGDYFHDKEQNIDKAIEQYERMYQTATARENDDYAREAQEKIASMKIEKLMNEEAPNIDRLEKAVDSSVGLNPRREALERLQQYTNNVRNQVHKIYDAVPEPSDWFKQYNKDQLDILDESVKNYAAYKEEDEKYFQKPLIANGIVLGVVLVATLIGGPLLGLLALLLGVGVINFLNSGAFFGFEVLSPNTNNCFMATMGRTRCLLIELGMILIGSFILATFGAR